MTHQTNTLDLTAMDIAVPGINTREYFLFRVQ